MKKLDLTGQKYGKLTVLGPGNPKLIGKKHPKNRGTWLCRCDCGKEIEVLRCNLKRQTRSCGCLIQETIKYNFVDLTSQKIEKLTVIKMSDKKTKTRGVLWECLCECGKTILLPSNSLISRNTTSCGDIKIHPRNIGFCGEIPISHIHAIKNNAIKRRLEFCVSGEYLWELFIKQDRRCTISNRLLTFTSKTNPSLYRGETTASLDRIDSSRGYIEGNVQWLHKDINKMKFAFSDEKFIDICKEIYLFNKNKARPSWDEYFLNIATEISSRSDDQFIKHGAVIIDNDSKHILGTGYNNTIRGFDEDLIDLGNRELRRPYMIHAESLAIMNCTKSAFEAKNGCSIYVTGLPCVSCLQQIISFGIKRVVYRDSIGSITENRESDEIRRNILLSRPDIEIMVLK